MLGERGRNVLWSQLLEFQGEARKQRGVDETSGASKTTTEADALASYIPHAIHGTQSGIRQETDEELNRRDPQLHDVLKNLRSLANEARAQATLLDPKYLEKLDGLKSSLLSTYNDAWLHSAARRWTSLRSTMEDLGRDNEEELHAFGQNSTLAELLTGGYVVLLNAHATRFDALIIRSAMDARVQIDHIPLPELSVDIARQWAESIQIGMYDLQEGAIGVREIENIILIPILQELWRTAVSPILTHLGISDTACPARIWWCLSGPLAFLPLHAAGPYQDDAPGVPDLVVSSYTPTLRSLLRAYQAPRAAFSMLAIAQPDAPGTSPLPAVRKELSTIERASLQAPYDPCRSRRDPDRRIASSFLTYVAAHYLPRAPRSALPIRQRVSPAQSTAHAEDSHAARSRARAVRLPLCMPDVRGRHALAR